MQTFETLAHPVDFGDCRIEHFSNGNGGIILVYSAGGNHLTETIGFIDGEDIGVTFDSSPDEVNEKAAPFFKVILRAHNQALALGRQIGKAEAQAAVRKAIGA